MYWKLAQHILKSSSSPLLLRMYDMICLREIWKQVAILQARKSDTAITYGSDPFKARAIGRSSMAERCDGGGGQIGWRPIGCDRSQSVGIPFRFENNITQEER